MVVIASLLDGQVELLCYSVLKLRLTKVAFLNANIRYVWQQHGSTVRKVITKGVQLEDLNAINSLNHCLSITCHDTILVYVLSETETVQFDHKSTLKFTEPIDAVIHLKDSAQNAMIVVAGQYIIAYLVERDSVQVLFEPTITSVKHRPPTQDSRSRWQRLHLPSITNDDITDTFGLKSRS